MLGLINYFEGTMVQSIGYVDLSIGPNGAYAPVPNGPIVVWQGSNRITYVCDNHGHLEHYNGPVAASPVEDQPESRAEHCEWCYVETLYRGGDGHPICEECYTHQWYVNSAIC